MMTHRYNETGGIVTDAHYWDCECDTNYIHHISDVEPCQLCGADPDEQPNSRVNEILQTFNAFERAEHDEIASEVTKLRRYQVSVTLDKFVDVVADTEQESRRLAQGRIDKLVKDLLVTHVKTWDMAVGDMFYEPVASVEETETDDEDEAWHWALRSKDYLKKDDKENDDGL